MIRKLEGLVIRSYRMSESSKVVLVYSGQYGKLRLVAKGARRPKSRFGASLEPITQGRYVVYWKENRELQTLSEGDILQAYPEIKQSFLRTYHAGAVLELVDRMTADEDRNPMLYSSAIDTLSCMSAVAESSLELPVWYFQLRSASALGYRPHLTGCAGCGSPVSGDRISFCPSLGGVACEACRGPGVELSPATLEFLVRLQVSHPEQVVGLDARHADGAQVRNALRRFLDHHIDGHVRMRSWGFLDRLRVDSHVAPGGPAVSLAAEGSPAPYGETRTKRR